MHVKLTIYHISCKYARRLDASLHLLRSFTIGSQKSRGIENSDMSIFPKIDKSLALMFCG